jgi:hypothetical protein
VLERHSIWITRFHKLGFDVKPPGLQRAYTGDGRGVQSRVLKRPAARIAWQGRLTTVRQSQQTRGAAGRIGACAVCPIGHNERDRAEPEQHQVQQVPFVTAGRSHGGRHAAAPA